MKHETIGYAKYSYYYGLLQFALLESSIKVSPLLRAGTSIFLHRENLHTGLLSLVTILTLGLLGDSCATTNYKWLLLVTITGY